MSQIHRITWDTYLQFICLGPSLALITLNGAQKYIFFNNFPQVKSFWWVLKFETPFHKKYPEEVVEFEVHFKYPKFQGKDCWES